MLRTSVNREATPDGGCLSVAHIPMEWRGEANAKLIAAAPEMLALLRELRDDAVCFSTPKQSGHTTGTSRRANVSWDLVVRAGALLERFDKCPGGPWIDGGTDECQKCGKGREEHK